MQTVIEQQELSDFNISVSGNWLSDLWFNFSHDHWNALFKNRPGSRHPTIDTHGPTADEQRRAVEEDAADFLASIGPQTHNDLEAFTEALVEDFLSRV